MRFCSPIHFFSYISFWIENCGLDFVTSVQQKKKVTSWWEKQGVTEKGKLLYFTYACYQMVHIMNSSSMLHQMYRQRIVFPGTPQLYLLSFYCLIITCDYFLFSIYLTFSIMKSSHLKTQKKQHHYLKVVIFTIQNEP